MNDTVSKRYYQVIEDLELDSYPMKEYDDLDIVSMIVDLEKAFNIQINDDKADELFMKGSHEDWIEYIRTLL